jgi:hypothetical protein
MSVAERYDQIIKVEPRIKILGILKDGSMDLNVKNSNENLDDNAVKLSFLQTHHIIEIGKRFSNELGKLEYIAFEYDKLKLFDLPAKEEIITFAITKDVDDEEIVKTISDHVLESERGKVSKEEGSYKKSTTGDLWQNYMLNYIEFMKEFTITSIQNNEKMLMTLWKKFNK